MSELNATQLDQLEHLTFFAAREHSPEWLPTPPAARATITEARAPGIVSRVLLDSEETPIAWVAAAHAWGRVWELHPLLVQVEHQRQGHGRRLVQEIEHEAASRGGLTMWVGTSDTTAATSLSGADLYVDAFDALATIQGRKPHPFQFWQRVGYLIVGVVPDAEGPGQPSICLAKRLGLGAR